MALPEDSPNSESARAQLAKRLTALVCARLNMKKLPGNDTTRPLMKLIDDIARQDDTGWRVGGRQFLNWCRCDPVPPDGK